MATQNNDKPLDISNLITFIVSIICFIADWITISLFIRDLVDEELPFGRGISEISVIVGIFIFGFFLLQHSNLGNKTSLLYWIIAWPYVLISGVLLAIASFKFLWFWNYSLGTYIYYIFMTLLISVFGIVISSILKKTTKYFSYAYILVAMEQACLWIYLFYVRADIPINSIYLGNVILFVFVGFMVVVNLKIQEI